MEMVWLELRADLRQRWRALLSLALLLGLIGGVVLTAAAGARRTDTAYPRLLTWANATQVELIPAANDYPADYYAALAKLPQVAQLSTEVLYQVTLPTARHAYTNQVYAISSPDHAVGVSADKVKILAGRPFQPQQADQAMIDPQLAALEHVSPGGTLRLLGVPNFPNGMPDFAKRVPVSFRVSAVVVFDNQVVPIGGGSGSGNIEPTALVSSFPVPGAVTTMSYGNAADVRLRPGATVADLTRAATALAQRYKDTSGQILTSSEADQVAATQQAIRPQAIALAAFAALAGLIALAVIGQLLSRQLALDSAEFPVLRAIGATRGSLVALSLARLAVVTLAGGVIAVAVAIAASPLMPIGPARLAEPHPGVEVNLAILGAGFAAIALLPLALLAGAAWRAARAAGRWPGPLGVAEPAQPGRRSRIGGTLTRSGPVTGGVGVAMAFEPGHGRTAVPVRSALAASVIAVIALTAAAVFGTSLVALVSTPHDYGQNWDAQLDLEFGGAPGALGARVISAEPAVTGYASGNYGQLEIGGQIVPAIGVDQPPGGGYLTMLAGRPPADGDEIALGAQTLRTLHARLGQTIPVTVEQFAAGLPVVRRDMRVTGVAALPAFGRGTFSPTDLGTGAVTTASVLSVPSVPDATSLCVSKTATCYNFFLLRFRPGTDVSAAAATLTSAITKAGCPLGSCAVTTDQSPSDIKNYASVRDTPLVLAAALIVFAVGTLAHVLLTGVRRRRRDLALLKTLGFTRSQVLATVAWQASTFASVALLIGLPLGVLAGRWAWAYFANEAGAPAQATVPLPTVLLAIPVTLLLANIIAAWPGWTAARLRPALVLRTE
jgi:ABC-type antimicrobial peptide transport system permease subunit